MRHGGWKIQEQSNTLSQDKSTSSRVTFRSHTLMRPESITWLNQFASLPLMIDVGVIQKALLCLLHKV